MSVASRESPKNMGLVHPWVALPGFFRRAVRDDANEKGKDVGCRGGMVLWKGVGSFSWRFWVDLCSKFGVA